MTFWLLNSADLDDNDAGDDYDVDHFDENELASSSSSSSSSDATSWTRLSSSRVLPRRIENDVSNRTTTRSSRVFWPNPCRNICSDVLDSYQFEFAHNSYTTMSMPRPLVEARNTRHSSCFVFFS